MTIDMTTLTQLAQIVGALLLIRYVLDTYRTVRATSYFAVMREINGKENLQEVNELKDILEKGRIAPNNIDNWPTEAVVKARAITNRYQIVSHLVERNFLSKAVS